MWSSFGLNDEIVVIINDDKCIFFKSMLLNGSGAVMVSIGR